MRLRPTPGAILMLLLLPSLSGAAGSPGKLSQSQARRLLDKGALVVDVRTAREYASRHIKGSTNIPVDQVSKRIGEVAAEKSARILVHCESGRRSATAVKQLAEQGYTNVWDLGSFKNAQKLTGNK